MKFNMAVPLNTLCMHVADVLSGGGILTALWGKPEGQRRRLHHQHMRLGQGFRIPGAGPLCLGIPGGCGAGAGSGTPIQRAQTGSAALCPRRAATQVWWCGRTLQGLQTRDPRRQDPRVFLWLPWHLVLPTRFRCALFRRAHLQDRGALHSGLVPAAGHVAGWHTAEAGPCEPRAWPDPPRAER